MSNKEEWGLRSDFLIHWTGGLDFEKKIIDSTTRREEYIERLYTTLIKQNLILFSVPSTPYTEKDLDRGKLPETIQTEFQRIGSFIISDTCSPLKVEDGKWLIKANGQTKYTIERENAMLNIYTGAQGLWMNWQKIECIPDGRELNNSLWPATCFTEIKLSNTLEHAKRYGFLGFGFSRDFVMKRFGAPVQYVRGEKEKDSGANDVVLWHFYKSLRILEKLEEKTVEYEPLDYTLGRIHSKNPPGFAEFIQAIGLDQILKQESLDQRPAEAVFGALRASIMSCAIFVKRMSDKKCQREFELLDEAEWRIPYTKRMDEEELIWRMYGYRIDCRPACMIPFTQNDLKILIFPDDETRRQALDEKTIQSKHIVEWLFKDPANVPIIATVKECLQF